MRGSPSGLFTLRGIWLDDIGSGRWVEVLIVPSKREGAAGGEESAKSCCASTVLVVEPGPWILGGSPLVQGLNVPIVVSFAFIGAKVALGFDVGVQCRAGVGE